jgi:hypothetical protein
MKVNIACRLLPGIGNAIFDVIFLPLEAYVIRLFTAVIYELA